MFKKKVYQMSTIWDEQISHCLFLRVFLFSMVLKHQPFPFRFFLICRNYRDIFTQMRPFPLVKHSEVGPKCSTSDGPTLPEELLVFVL